MKLYEKKITVETIGNHDHIDDEALVEICDEIGEEIAEFMDRLTELINRLASKKNVKLSVYSD
jgi:hypothetical protein